MDKIQENMLGEALKYAELGFSIIPVSRDKTPLIQWKEFQTRRATKDEIKSWFEQFPDMNIGVVTGSISGVIVIDVE
ncbi:MAG: bifunctional DNA primase/polymerase, partial [Patescibacteria group bacterium]